MRKSPGRLGATLTLIERFSEGFGWYIKEINRFNDTLQGISAEIKRYNDIQERRRPKRTREAGKPAARTTRSSSGIRPTKQAAAAGLVECSEKLVKKSRLPFTRETHEA